MKAGEGILAATQSGNRDEDVFPDPDVFDMHRKRGSEQALGFGFGDHQCVAEWLARAELEIVFGELMSGTNNTKLIHDCSYIVPKVAEFEDRCSVGGGPIYTTNNGCWNRTITGGFLGFAWMDVRQSFLVEESNNQQNQCAWYAIRVQISLIRKYNLASLRLPKFEALPIPYASSYRN